MVGVGYTLMASIVGETMGVTESAYVECEQVEADIAHAHRSGTGLQKELRTIREA
jgi:hypothetical protein